MALLPVGGDLQKVLLDLRLVADSRAVLAQPYPIPVQSYAAPLQPKLAY